MAEKFSLSAMEGIAHRVSYEHRVSQNSLLLDAAEYTFTDRELYEVLGFVELMNNTTSPNDSALPSVPCRALPPSHACSRLGTRRSLQCRAVAPGARTDMSQSLYPVRGTPFRWRAVLSSLGS